MRPHRFNNGRPSAFGLHGARMLAGSAALAGAAAWVSGCSVLYDLSTTQCSTDAECDARWPGLVCKQDLGICGEPEFECRTNQDCIDSQEFFGSAAACIQNECAALQTPECPTVLPLTDDAYFDNLTAENPLILGAFGEITDGLSNLVKNYDLALTEFTRAAVGRPLVMVVCHDQPADDTELDAAMTHLADTLKVPGVVSSLASSDLQHVFEGKGLENNMFFMSSQDSDSTLIRLEDRGLLWHALSGGEALAQSYAPVVARALAYIEEPTEPVRIAQVIAPDYRLLQDIADTVLQTITFNGKSAGANLAEDNYLPINVTSIFADPEAIYTDQILRLREFKPHIVIATATREFVTTIAPQLEQNWAADAGSQPRPFYILSPIHYGDQQAAAFANTPERRARIVGLNAPAAADDTVYTKYLSNWVATYNEAPPLSIENYYDAAQYLLYSALAAGQRLQSGDDLLRGMGRLISLTGEPFEMGYADLADVARELDRSSAPISLIGTMGPPNFDNNGGRADAASVWCFNSAGVRQSDVLRYNQESGEMEGSLDACFTGF